LEWNQTFHSSKLRLIRVVAVVLVHRNVVDLVVAVIEDRGLPLGKLGHVPVRTSDRHQFEGGIKEFQGLGGLKRNAPVFVGGLLAHLPGAVELVPQAPELDVVGVLHAVGLPQV